MSKVPDLSPMQYKALRNILSNNGMSETSLIEFLAKELHTKKDFAYFTVRQIIKRLRDYNLVTRTSQLFSSYRKAEEYFNPTEFAKENFPKIRIKEDSEADPLKLYV